MDNFEGKEEYFEVDVMCDGKPVELLSGQSVM